VVGVGAAGVGFRGF
jgi:hypothetical protein